MTNGDFISDALRLIGAIPETGNASAEQGANGLRMLNSMVAEWQADEIDIEYGYAENLTDDCEVEPMNRQAVMYNLAIRLFGVYPQASGLRPDLVALAQSGYDRLLRTTMVAGQTEASMSHLPAGEGQRDPGSILTG